MKESIFTKILNKETKGRILFEMEHTAAIMDAFPEHKGHSLIIPKKVYVDIFTMPENELKEVLIAGKIVAKAIKSAFNPDGFNFVQNNGKKAGQVIMHYHMHVIPRYKGDGPDSPSNALSPSGYNYEPTKKELDAVYNELKKYIKI